MAGDSHERTTLDIWGDYACPFCWLAEPVVDAAQAALDIPVRRRGFELRPLPAPLPEARYLRRLWVMGVAPIAQSLGVQGTFPAIFPRTRMAHEAVAFARSGGHGDALHRALFAAYFNEGRDIGRSDVLARLAEGVGLDPDALVLALDNETYVDDVLVEARTARALGIRSLPTFVLNRDGEPALRTGWCDAPSLTRWLHRNLEMERA